MIYLRRSPWQLSARQSSVWEDTREHRVIRKRLDGVFNGSYLS